MSGIINSTGAKSGIIGTTVGTPSSTPAVFYGSGVTDSPTSEIEMSSNTVSDPVPFNYVAARIDTDSFWDSTNHRYTPTTAGYYYYSSGIRVKFDEAGIADMRIYVYKNGSPANVIHYKLNAAHYMDTSLRAGPTGIISLNGSGDYIDIRVRISGFAGDISDQAFATGNGSYFNIFFVRSNT